MLHTGGKRIKSSKSGNLLSLRSLFRNVGEKSECRVIVLKYE